jgi:hypothetical protein
MAPAGSAVRRAVCSSSVHRALEAIQGLKKGRTRPWAARKPLPVPEAWVDAIESRAIQQVWAMIRLQSLTGTRPGVVPPTNESGRARLLAREGTGDSPLPTPFATMPSMSRRARVSMANSMMPLGTFA